jgi:hypothetical protein
MTPKEKAKELFDKYSFVEIANYTSMFEVKQCALIAVDEIINCTKNGLGHTVFSKEYWHKVKTDIEKL